jgi:hypothetical protein
MKSTMLLATGLFLISAPAPDADDIAEMTANFIVPNRVSGSLTADVFAENPAEFVEMAASSENRHTAQIHVPEGHDETEPTPAG